MEKFCPVCSRVYGEEATHCEADKERLVILKEEPSLVGHILDGKYTLHAKLGEGGMGSVYLAEQATMGREVAIKVLRREFSQNRLAIKRFLREARAASKLGHPNTITVYDFGQSNDGLLYLVMERLTGRPLGDILDDDGAMSVERTIHILAQICDSLSEAHAAGITHRDLKPENIFIEQKAGNPDFVKVLDFGIAKMQGDEVTQATATGMICGTPSYMSPEQAMGRDIDGRSDIYALGILLYEMLTDEKPFTGDTPMEVMLKHINEPPPNIYQRTQLSVPEGLQEVLEQMLAKKPAGRPADCQALKALLLAGVDTPFTGPITSTTDPSLSQRRRDDTAERDAALEKTGLSPAVQQESFSDLMQVPRRGRGWIAAIAAVALLGGGAAAAYFMSQGPETPPPVTASRAPVSGPAGGESASAKTPPTPGVAVDPATVGEVNPGDTVDGDATSGAHGGVAVADAGDRGVALDVQPDTPPEPERVTLEIKTDPAGAEAYEGEQLLGTTPLTFDRDKDSGDINVTLKLARYKSKELTIGTTGNVVQHVALKRVVRAGTHQRPPGAHAKPAVVKPPVVKPRDGSDDGKGFQTF